MLIVILAIKGLQFPSGPRAGSVEAWKRGSVSNEFQRDECGGSLNSDRKHPSSAPDQATPRYTASSMATGVADSVEPLLLEEDGKEQDEFDWRLANMDTDCFKNDHPSNGVSRAWRGVLTRSREHSF